MISFVGYLTKSVIEELFSCVRIKSVYFLIISERCLWRYRCGVVDVTHIEIDEARDCSQSIQLLAFIPSMNMFRLPRLNQGSLAIQQPYVGIPPPISIDILWQSQRYNLPIGIVVTVKRHLMSGIYCKQIRNWHIYFHPARRHWLNRIVDRWHQFRQI